MVHLGRFTQQIGTSGHNVLDVFDAAGRVALGEPFGMTAVTLEPLIVAVGGVFVGLFEIRGDGSMNERFVDTI